ncbi:MAG: hypothetical protein A2113_02485 [Candidatus Woykebacteria bacterium GWA1_44_8]|uniref:DUF5666 domain-containing protein n=1 Tax=Candidatus Woykebacteria bacterium GWA1_44_8 TaxID=1802591 RepID=A0A1G1W302_9BACT|nr:MAG: hypothetical protein A2113_02485 [Candidatus Woykebacteria bacterium GWA1_44_8]
METPNTRTPTILILIIGIIIGLLLAGGFVLLKSAFRGKEQSTGTQETKGLLLTISEPADGAFVGTETLTIKGSTGKDAVVAVVGGTEDTIVETSGGNFSASNKIAEGENELTVYAFDPTTGESTQTTLNVSFLNEEVAMGRLLVAQSTTAEENSKEKIDKLRERLATKSSELKKVASTFKNSHVFGTISAINDTVLTIETKQGSVKTVFTDDITKFYSIGSGGRSTIAITDLKAGDEIAAVGVTKNDTSGTAKFIIRQEQTPQKRHAVAGKVKSNEGGTITLTHLTQTERTYTVKTTNETVIKVKGVDTATIADIKTDDVVVACGPVEKDGTIVAKRLFAIPGKFLGVKPKESTTSATPSSSQ